MKTGDPKQVAALSVVALFAVGFVGNSAFKTIQQNSFSGPVLVEEIGRDGTVSTDEKGARESTSQSTVADVFADSFAPENKSGNQKNLVEVGAIDTELPTIPSPPAGEIPEPLPGVTEPAEPETKPAKEEPIVQKPAPKPKSIHYLGFVESGSGSASAILTVDGVSVTVSEGDSLGDQFTVKTISSNSITVKKSTETYSIFIGKEKHIS